MREVHDKRAFAATDEFALRPIGGVVRNLFAAESRHRPWLEVPMVKLFAAAALAAASLSAPAIAAPGRVQAEQPEARPAMFVVRDADTTIYLFGTFHALDGRADWFGHQVRKAFDHSDELVLETLVPEGRAVAAARSLPARAFQDWSVTPSASFLATSRMAINAGRARGMQVANGADMMLRRAAELAGKDVEGLETIESQLAMFTRMPAPAVPAMAAGTPVTPANEASMEDLSDTMAQMQSAWRRGDQRLFVTMLSELRASSPMTYATLFAARNARWADWIGARMQQPGTVFVAVGAGHLAGPDSLLVRLAEMGIESARVD